MKRLTLFLLALTFASQGWGQGIQFDRISPKGVFSVPPSPVFTNTQMNEYFTSLLNGLNVSTEYNATQGLNYSTDGAAFGVAAPVGSTVHQANGLAGYASTLSSATFPVGVYGQARCLVSGSTCWQFNGVTQDTAVLTGHTMNGYEIDMNVLGSPSVVRGLFIAGASNGTMPSSSYGIVVGVPGSGKQWNTGILLPDGASANGISLGGTGTGNSVSSQPVNLIGRDAGGVQRTAALSADLNGNLIIQVPSGKVASTPSLLVNGQVTLGSTTVGSLPSAASNTFAQIGVTDSTAIASEGQTCVGGGSTKAIAISNGSVWKCF